MLKHLTTAAMAATLLAGSTLASFAAGHAEYKIRATANSNENDEDYDGLVVFKNYVEAASNGAIEVELFIGTQLCSKGAECLQGVADGSIDVYISTSGGAAGIFPYVRPRRRSHGLSCSHRSKRVLWKAPKMASQTSWA